MRRRLVVARAVKSASVVAALMACPLAQATSVQTVFSAENALYGAGYGIGQADGWIDDRLRSAIRQYQEGRPGLSATGELDSPTLEALGISGGRSELMGGNGVADRETARKELGLADASTSTISAPKPAQAPIPAPKPKVVKVAEISEPEVKVEKPPTQATPKPVEKPLPEPQLAKAEPKLKAPEEKSAPESEPEPRSEPIVIASTVRVSDDSADAKKPALVKPVKDETNEVAKTEILPPEPIEASSEQEPALSASGDESETQESSGNVITRMFDFLFGWMV